MRQRETLIDFFDDFSRARGEFLAYDNGYRSWIYTYADVARASRAFSARLRAAGISKGDKVLFWGENRPEWIVALWGCLLEGAVVVPIDYRASAEFLRSVERIVDARLIFVGDEAPAASLGASTRSGATPPVWRLADIDVAGAPPVPDHDRPAIARDDVAEIIFTSGATAEPKGVVITHRNILANIEPVEAEIDKYRVYGRPFRPLRFLNLLPLSHLFGQAMATFIPPLLPGTVVFMRGYNPHEIVRQVSSRRISVIVCVPKILDVLRDHVVRLDPRAAQPEDGKPHVARRWWKYRAIHRMFGVKFWAFVVGAAPLEAAMEEFWSRLGFLVIQGYGLTETAPIVSLNHPFSAHKGSVGKAIAGVEVTIAPDGEILVRGDNVTTGYYKANAETAQAFSDGWLHTGDIGAFDEEGRLYIRGRKKEMIVTPEGLNVFPEDVERVLNALPGVGDSAVVGVSTGGEERVHAVLVLERPAGAAMDPQEIARAANAQLADHQKIRGVTSWPGDELPRTEGTRKLRRREIRRWLEGGEPPRAAHAAGDPLVEALSRFAAARALTDQTTIDELGLSSLERVELMAALEDRFQTTIDEMAFSDARTVGDLRALVEREAVGAGRPAGIEPAAHLPEPIDFPSWNRRLPARALRRVSLPTWILPVARLFAWIRVDGREHLEALRGPVLFAANHQSHIDVPAILIALPRRWRYRLAPTMAKEFFRAHFHPEQHTRRERFTSSLNYYLAALFFNAFPLPQREAGARQAMRYAGEVMSEGDSVVIFPEGGRTEHGEIRPFRPGIGMIASRLQVPVVPVRLEGFDRILHHTWRMAWPGRARVAFGAPLDLRGDDYVALARRVEDAVRGLAKPRPGMPQ